MQKVSVGELKRLFYYNPLSGVFTRVVSNHNKYKVGSIAGTLDGHTGYIRIRINGKGYYAHRLAFLYMTGSMPKIVDHDNRVRDDNRWENLNNGTYVDNARNQPISSRNTSNTTGVSWNKKRCRWHSRIGLDGNNKHLGFFIDYSDAVSARKNAEVLYGYHEN